MNILLGKKEAIKLIQELTGYNYIHTPNCSGCFLGAVTTMKNKIQELLNIEQTKLSESEKIYPRSGVIKVEKLEF